MTRWTTLCLTTLALAAFGCDDDDDGGSEAQRRGIGAACGTNDDCIGPTDAGPGLECLPFKGGYCGARACTADEDCPAGSACVTHEGANYCFLVCADKPECNTYRSEDEESNCSSSVEFVNDRGNRKACVPPSGS